MTQRKGGRFERKFDDFFRDLRQEYQGRLEPEPQKAADGVCEATEYLYYEFTTKATVAEVKQIFKDLHVIYGFKVIGAGQHIFVVKNDQSQALREFRLPSDAIRTATTFALETAYYFLSKFDIRQKIGVPPRFLPSRDLTYFEKTWAAEGMSETQFKAALREHVQQVQKDPQRLNGVAFFPAGTLPIRFMYFWNQRDCDMAKIVFNNNDAAGGPGCVSTRTMKLYNIYEEEEEKRTFKS
ncbi:hypothetical protein ACOMHN_010706 [Nucella lapillus]